MKPVDLVIFENYRRANGRESMIIPPDVQTAITLEIGILRHALKTIVDASGADSRWLRDTAKQAIEDVERSLDTLE